MKVITYGSALTLGLIVFKNEIVIPIQDEFSSNKPLGIYSKYGDISGQLLPNLIYTAYMGLEESNNSSRRAQFMLKSTLLSGMTTFFLKRVFNARRPNNGDRLSFPSGHTTTAFAFAGVIGIEHPRYALAAYSLATFVGLSRMNDNAHFLYDVTLGATIGIAYAYGLRNNVEKKKSSEFSIYPTLDGAKLHYSYHF